MALTILDSNQIIAQRVKKAIREAMLKDKFIDKMREMVDFIYEFLYEKFITSSTYYSLIGGTLRAELGLDDSEVAKLPQMIADMLVAKAYVDFSNGKTRVIISFIDKDFDPNKVGSYTSVNKKGETTIIPWLYWLLTAGTENVVTDHYMKLIPGAGRSEMAIMIKEEGETFSVDPEYAGTENDNWITKTIRYNFPEIRAKIIGILNNDS